MDTQMQDSELNDGGSAFPAMTPGGYCTPGMTLRDYFAAQALHNYLRSSIPNDRIADQCYGIADAMLAAREHQPDTSTSQQIALGIGGAE